MRVRVEGGSIYLKMPNLGKKYYFEVMKNFLAGGVLKSIKLDTLRPKIKITINSIGFLVLHAGVGYHRMPKQRIVDYQL